MAKPLFIAIGVSSAAGMPPLAGVQTGVNDLSQWAARSGYEIIQIDDRQYAVTVDRIREKLTPPDGKDGTIPDLLLDRPRIVVYFCGHGLSSWPDQYWVLSAGPQFTRQRISANAFRDTLATYGPRQIAMISDACRTTQHVIGAGDPVVDPYAGASVNVEKDRFYSSRDGAASFSIPARGDAPAYCVFSSVLIRALSSPDGLNLDRQYLREGRLVVSSRSLSEYLDEHVVRAAVAANQFQESQCEPGFGIDRDSYIEFDPELPPSPAAPKSGDEAISAEHALPSLTFNTTTEEDSASRRLMNQRGRIQRSRSEWRAPLRQLINEEVRQNWRFDGHFGPLIVSGFHERSAISAQSESRVFRNVGGYPNTWFRLQATGGRSHPVLVTSGHWTTIVPMFDGLWCAVVVDSPYYEFASDTGVEMLAWGNVYGVEPEDIGTLDPSEALKGLANGSLISEDVDVLADRFRKGKHADPMLGIVCAYLYNGIGDINNIRRMCYYYSEHYQDVPFDIAMLAGLPLQSTDGRTFFLEVPEVPEDPAGRSRGGPKYTWEATPSVTVGIAGMTPVVRAGWPHLRRSSYRVHRQFWELIDYLAPAPVSTFEGSEASAQLVEILWPSR